MLREWAHKKSRGTTPSRAQTHNRSNKPHQQHSPAQSHLTNPTDKSQTERSNRVPTQVNSKHTTRVAPWTGEMLQKWKGNTSIPHNKNKTQAHTKTVHQLPPHPPQLKGPEPQLPKTPRPKRIRHEPQPQPQPYRQPTLWRPHQPPTKPGQSTPTTTTKSNYKSPTQAILKAQVDHEEMIVAYAADYGEGLDWFKNDKPEHNKFRHLSQAVVSFDGNKRTVTQFERVMLPRRDKPNMTFRYIRIHPATYYMLPTTYYLLPATYYLLPTTYLSTTYYLPATYYIIPTTYYKLPTTYCMQPTAYHLLPTIYYLPTTYYLLPTTYYKLPTTYYIHPIPAHTPPTRQNTTPTCHTSHQHHQHDHFVL